MFDAYTIDSSKWNIPTLTRRKGKMPCYADKLENLSSLTNFPLYTNLKFYLKQLFGCNSRIKV